MAGSAGPSEMGFPVTHDIGRFFDIRKADSLARQRRNELSGFVMAQKTETAFMEGVKTAGPKQLVDAPHGRPSNDTERSIRDLVAVDPRMVRFPDWRAARNFAILRTFAATCEKNGISAYRATIRMARDPTWSIFTDGNTPAHLRGKRGATKDEQAASAEPDPAQPRLLS